MKRVFLVSIASGYGGAERSMELIASHVPSDIEVCIFASHAEHISALKHSALPANVTVIEVADPRSLSGRRRAALRLLQAYWRYRPDSVVLNTHSSALIAAMAARWIPQFGRLCSLYLRDFQWTDLDYIFTRLRYCDVLVPSDAVSDRPGYLAPWYIGPAGDHACTVVPDMVATVPGPAGDDGYFLHLATVNPWKGHVDLILALRALGTAGGAESTVSVQSFGLVADHALRNRLAALVTRLGLESRVQLNTYQADPLPVMQRCRAVVVPSVSHSGGPETFGRTVIEAWACGKPVIAYAAGGPGLLIRHGVDGLLVPEGDIAGLAEAMARLDGDADLCSRLGKAGQQRVAADYTAQRVVSQLFRHLAQRSAE